MEGPFREGRPFSFSSTAGDAQIDDKRITDWLPVDLVFKNPHPGCKL